MGGVWVKKEDLYVGFTVGSSLESLDLSLLRGVRSRETERRLESALDTSRASLDESRSPRR